MTETNSNDVSINNEQTEQTEAQPYKVFQNESEYNSFLESQKKSLKTSLERTIRAKAQKEAEMTAEQKNNERIKELEEENRLLLVSKNRSVAQSELLSSGLDLKKHSEIVDIIATEDESASLERAKLLADFVLHNAKLISDHEKKQTMIDVAKPEETKETETKEDEVAAKRLGKTKANIYKMAYAAIKNYM